MDLKVKDNDRDEITVMDGETELRGWSYANDTERRVKMLCAREYVEGWYAGAQAEATVDQEVSKYAHQMVCRVERERMAQLLTGLFHKMKPGGERFAIAMAVNVIRRGRELTEEEKLENLFAALEDKPAPHPMPTVAQ